MFTSLQKRAASFRYNGEEIALVPARMETAGNGVYEHTLPDGLTAILEIRTPAPGARAQRLRFEHRGTENSGAVSHVCALDAAEPVRGPAVWEGLKGDSCGVESFAPLKKTLAQNESVYMEPTGGRPSDTAGFPFFDLALNGAAASFGIGWGGQWFLRVERAAGALRLRAGLAETETYLYPGEAIAGPRVLWAEGIDIPAARRALRRLLLEKYSPRAKDGGYVRLPLALSCYDRYHDTLPFWATTAGQTRCAQIAAACGMDTLWLDAAWFAGGFPNGVGNHSYAAGFPDGVGAAADAAHANGLRFLQWFEPERANCYSETAREHPGDVICPPRRNSVNCLVNIGDPAVRRRVTDLLKERIRAGKPDIYRQDFNMSPLEYWRAADGPGRRGITEIRFVEGLYAMWDELLAAFPGLLIDNCASGGRRLEPETVRRAVPLWRSDTGCFPVDANKRCHTWAQNQILALSRYLPYHGSGVWAASPYLVRSAFAGGLVFDLDVFSPDFNADAVRPVVEEARRLRRYWTGDFYPLTAPDNSETVWAAWQLALPDEGLVCAFRRDACAEETFAPGLCEIDEEKTYGIRVTNEALQTQTRRLAGGALKRFVFACPAPGTSVILEYRQEA